MRLRELLVYSEINIQCHDNPDPDTIASGFALYCYFKEFGKKVRLFYSGNRIITKPNIIMLVEALNIPIEYIQCMHEMSGLLITVDCQYGAGNVTYLRADEIAVIDHHIQERPPIHRQEIRSDLASCSTLVWDMLCDEGIEANDSIEIATALYYGLFSDSSGFTELRHALDKDMRDSLRYNVHLLKKLKNSVITLKELEIAGLALIRSSYNETNKYVMIKTEECDPNILGLISDFVLQVDSVNVVIAYSETIDGIKYSVRSCIKEIMANELAGFLSKDIGSGGGHSDKAAGFICRYKYNECNRYLNADEYFLRRLTEYYQTYEVIYEKDYELPEEMTQYKKYARPMGYVKLDPLIPKNESFVIRTKNKDIEEHSSSELVLLVDTQGQILLLKEEEFQTHYMPLETVISMPLDYFPRIRMNGTKNMIYLKNHIKSCLSKGEKVVRAKVLEKSIKLFRNESEEQYEVGQKGDYLVIEEGVKSPILIIEKVVFEENYEISESEGL